MRGDLLLARVGCLLLLLGWNAANQDENQKNSSKDSPGICITSADCAYNGECFKDDAASNNSTIDPETPGVCYCFDGWKGQTCEVLDLMPVDPHRVGLVLPNRDSSTWGGSVVYYEGEWHMFASEILYNCGLYSWTTNSQVIRATSKSPFGPYQKVQTILPPFAHDTNIVRAPTGEFVLYVTALKGVTPIDCRQNQTQSGTTATLQKQQRRQLRHSSNNDDDDDDDVPPKDTYMLWAPTPEGPWSEPVMVLNSTKYNSDYWKKYNKTAKCDSNLNGIILPATTNSSQPFLGLWRRCETENLLTIPHALYATDWKNASTYQPLLEKLFVLAGSGAEDPSNIWTTRTSDMAPDQVAYHVIFHDEQATRCMLGWCGGQGRHAFSLDGVAWRYASVNAYDRYVAWEENRTERADTRARPHVVLGPSTSDNPLENQKPIALSTGLKATDESGYVYTLVQPLNLEGRKAPAEQQEIFVD